MKTIAILNIGNELLRGRTVNSNAAFIGQLLQDVGIATGEIRMVGDRAEEIRRGMEEMMARFPAVLVTGGLGPTQDDITKNILLETFGGEWVTHQETLAQIQAFSTKTGRPMNPLNALQARVPSSCTVLMNHLGTAPGMVFRQGEKLLIALPGVPFEMQGLMQNAVLPLLIQELGVTPIARRVLRLYGLPESALALKMERIEPDYPEGLEVAYLPALDGISLEMKLIRSEIPVADQELNLLERRIREELGTYIFSSRPGKIEALFGKLLMERGLSVATAESATTGWIAQKLGNVSGISAVFQGGIVAYSAEAKSRLLGVDAEWMAREGMVGEEVARQMAEGARFVLGADIGLSCTGYAEPFGEGADQGPQAWIGFSDGKKTFATQLKMIHNRNVNRERMAYAAIIQAYKELGGD